jgi:hypothetical protein
VGAELGLVTLLYLLAITLVSYKVCADLDAFTKESSRVVDLIAFVVLGIILIVLALAMPQELTAFEPGCGRNPCASRV